MSNQIIFFGSSPEGVAAGWRHFRSSDGGEIAFLGVKGSRVEPPGDNLMQMRQRLAAQIDQSSGLMIVLEPSVNSVVDVHIRRRNAPSLEIPEEAVVIGPSGRPTWVSLKDSNFQLEFTEGLLLPVHDSQEKNLKAFLKALDDLPDDHRVSMLFTLLQPTFETRIARLEQIEAARKQPPPTGVKTGEDDDGAKRRHLVKSAVLGLAVAIVLGVFQFFLYRDLRQKLLNLPQTMSNPRGKDQTNSANSLDEKTLPADTTPKLTDRGQGPSRDVGTPSPGERKIRVDTTRQQR